MQEKDSTKASRKVIGVQIDPVLAEKLNAEIQERSTVARRVTVSDIVRESLFARYFNPEG